MNCLETKITLVCPKTKAEVSLKKDCSECKELQGVRVYDRKQVTITCKDEDITPKIMSKCPNGGQDIDTATCAACSVLEAFTFRGQIELRLICSWQQEDIMKTQRKFEKTLTVERLKELSGVMEF